MIRSNTSKKENRYKAIVIYTCPNGRTGAAKYHNILADRPAAWKRFEIFVKLKFPAVTHVNLYGGISGEFIRQEKLGEIDPDLVL